MDLMNQFFRYYPSGNSREGVQNLSPVHLTWLIVVLAILAIMIQVYKGLGDGLKQIMIRICAITMVVLYLQRSLWAAYLGHFRTDSMLPFHLCGVMIFIEVIAVFRGNKLSKEFAFCAGLPGATVALITPELNGYPLISFQYQAFILAHLLLMMIPLLWIFGDKYKPDRSYLPKTFSLLCLLAFANGLVNLQLHSNYMFVSKAPALPVLRIVEHQFGHVAYVMLLVITAFIVMNLMYAPWKRNQQNFR